MIDTTASVLAEVSKRYLGYQVKIEWVRKVLGLFVKADLAEWGKGEQVGINYKRFTIQSGDVESKDEIEELRLDHIREGIIRALTKTVKPVVTRARIVRSRKRRGTDEKQLKLL